MKFTRIAVTAAVTLAATTGLTAAVAAPAQAAAPCVQKIAVNNNAGFTMSFRVVTREGITSAPTDVYPINQWRVVDLTATELPVGADVRPLVSATAGNDVLGNNFVSYCDNGQTATYSVTGTTLNYQVTLLS
jgi:hypothetical protein